VIGALFIGGAARLCADDVDERSRREARTIPTMMLATTTSSR
jgi:hypothetical protein